MNPLSSTRPIVVLLMLAGSPALAQTFSWGRQFGTGAAEEATALAPDASGGVFVAGTRGSGYLLLYRYSREGSALWSHAWGTGQGDEFRGTAPDGVGGVFAAGLTHGALFGPTAEGWNGFIARYNDGGSLMWGRPFGGGRPAYAAAPDSAGGVYVAGLTTNSYFGPNAGSGDAYVARYDSAGTPLWGRQFGTTAGDDAGAAAPDGAGGVFVAGGTGGSLFGPFAGGSPDIFLAHYDGDGNLLRGVQFGTPAFDGSYRRALAPDGMGGVFIAGETAGSLFGQHAGGYTDAYIARFDSALNLVWGRQFGSVSDDAAHGVAADGAGGAFITGSTGASLLGPYAGAWDAFLARYNSAGNRIGQWQFGTVSSDHAYPISPNGQGGVYVGGYTYGPLFGPLLGSYDIFLARYITTCYPDCDTSTGPGRLDIFDFLCFQNRYDQRDPYACDCDTSTGPGACDIFDFLCFQNAYDAGCP